MSSMPHPYKCWSRHALCLVGMIFKYYPGRTRFCNSMQTSNGTYYACLCLGNYCNTNSLMSYASSIKQGSVSCTLAGGRTAAGQYCYITERNGTTTQEAVSTTEPLYARRLGCSKLYKRFDTDPDMVCFIWYKCVKAKLLK